MSSLSTSVQDLVTAMITQYVGDYDTATKTRLLADYRSGYAQTYVAWANSAGTYSATGPDIDTDGTYMRVEGPRVWIEVVLQNGIIVSEPDPLPHDLPRQAVRLFQRTGVVAPGAPGRPFTHLYLL